MSKIAELRQELADSRARLNEVLNQVGDRWTTQVYSDGAQWNVGQLLTHLMISEAGMFRTAKGIVNGEEGVPADFDLERYNKRSVEKQASMTPQQAHAELESTRTSLLAWMCDLSDEQLARTGRHASMKMLSVEEFLHTIASHEKTHAEDMARALAVS